MQHLHAINNFLDHGVRNKDYLLSYECFHCSKMISFLIFISEIRNEGGSWLQGTFYMLIIKVKCPIYTFIYPESETVLLAEDTSERQSPGPLPTTLSFIFSYSYKHSKSICPQIKCAPELF